jgi:hypothetical protein
LIYEINKLSKKAILQSISSNKAGLSDEINAHQIHPSNH